MVVAVLRLAVLALATAGRRVGPESPVVEVSSWVIAFALPGLAVAFLVGLVRWRLFIPACSRIAAWSTHCARRHGSPPYRRGCAPRTSGATRARSRPRRTSCLEALQNANKHARGATAAVLELSDNGVLHIEVRDDGSGFDEGIARAGAGFVNMRDRLAAVDGELVTHSTPGQGTRVIVTIPVEADG